MRLNQCTAGTIAAGEIYAKGVQMTYSHYLLNELIADAEGSREKGTPFHYSWLHILISFFAWVEPVNFQGVDMPV